MAYKGKIDFWASKTNFLFQSEVFDNILNFLVLFLSLVFLPRGFLEDLVKSILIILNLIYYISKTWHQGIPLGVALGPKTEFLYSSINSFT